MAAIDANLGREQFLQLLVAQLSNQDPLDPVNQQDYLGQLAQFSTLEGIEALNTSFTDMLSLQQLTQGAALLGTEVEYLPSDGETPVRGEISAVRNINGEIRLQVGDESIALGQIQRLIAPA